MRPRVRRLLLTVVLVGLPVAAIGGVLTAAPRPGDTRRVAVLGASLSDDTATTSLDSTSTTPTSVTSTSSTSTSSESTSSTSTSTTPTSAPGPSRPSAPRTVHVEGTFRGDEHFALFTGRCSLLDHHLDSVFTVDNAATWKFHSDYCGTIDDDLWRGQGTFTFTLEDGATLTGSFRDSARLPSAGEPYTLQITGGTRKYEGATGSCSLDNHLRQIRFGEQEQYGSFICDFRG